MHTVGMAWGTFDKLSDKNVPHILEKILLALSSLDGLDVEEERVGGRIWDIRQIGLSLWAIEHQPPPLSGGMKVHVPPRALFAFGQAARFMLLGNRAHVEQQSPDVFARSKQYWSWKYISEKKFIAYMEEHIGKISF